MTTAFDAVEILAEFSKAIRHGLIALEGLGDVDGVDQGKVCALTDAVRQVHAEATGYMASVIGATSGRELGAVGGEAIRAANDGQLKTEKAAVSE